MKDKAEKGNQRAHEATRGDVASTWRMRGPVNSSRVQVGRAVGREKGMARSEALHRRNEALRPKG